VAAAEFAAVSTGNSHWPESSRHGLIEVNEAGVPKKSNPA
jgi:hypothetical protein